MSSVARRPTIGVRYDVPEQGAGWELSNETMPESVLHDEAVTFLRALLAAWATRTGDGRVVRNLAVRWDARNPRIGVDPDIAVLAPPPPDLAELRSLRTWVDGHVAPMLAIEVVSETDPRKDYVVAPDKYAASGTKELWIFDPLLAGPAAHGGPFRLQVWTRDAAGGFSRLYAGEGPARSPALGAFLVATDEGHRLRISDDAGADSFWPTEAEAERAAKEAERAAKEAERAAKEAERAAKEAERAAKEAALARVAELEKLLASR